MGSSGSGSFSDYSENKPKPEKAGGGSSSTDKCLRAFATSLEDVERCTYYIRHKALPPIQSKVIISFNGTRIVALNPQKLEIGYLPTTYNYLRNCMDDGNSYSGVIRAQSISPSLSVLIDIAPD
jgi:hypothetical protein